MKLLTRKRKGVMFAIAAILGGAAMWQWNDKVSGTMLSGFGLWLLGKVGREWFPDSPTLGPIPPEKSEMHVVPKDVD